MYDTFINCCRDLIESFTPPHKRPGNICRVQSYINRLRSRIPSGQQANSTELKRALARERALYESNISCKNSKAFYRYVNSRLKDQDSIPALDITSKIITDPDGKAAAFAQFFSTMFTVSSASTPGSPYSPNPSPASDTRRSFREEDIYELLSSLKPKLSVTPDNLPPIFLKKFAIFLAEPLLLLFERSFNDSAVPKIFKHSIVTPIHKKGSRSSIDNYRPIAQGSIVCGILERLLVRHIENFLMANNLIDPCQHGFTRHRSTCTQLAVMCQDWAMEMNSSRKIECIYFDQKSAFDKVDHNLLLLKMERLGIHPMTINFLPRGSHFQRPGRELSQHSPPGPLGGTSRWMRIASSILDLLL
jgi:hypothetical protein